MLLRIAGGADWRDVTRPQSMRSIVAGCGQDPDGPRLCRGTQAEQGTEPRVAAMDGAAHLTWYPGTVLPYASLWHAVLRVIALNQLSSGCRTALAG